MTIARDELDAWREAISVAIGCIFQHEPVEAKRAAAINVLIEAHQKALAEFMPERRLH
jgi:hypothetical protein